MCLPASSSMVLTDGPESNGKKSTDVKSKVPEVSSLTGLEKQVEQAEVRPQGNQSGHLLLGHLQLCTSPVTGWCMLFLTHLGMCEKLP